MGVAGHVASYYAASANAAPALAPLHGETRADVCVIGGGYTGLSTAIHLRRLGYSVTLLEANKIGWGASGRNGGHVGTGQRLDQAQLEKWLGLDHAKALWQLGLEAVDTVCGLIEQHHIDCELKHGNLHVASKAADIADLRARLSTCNVFTATSRFATCAAELAQMTSARALAGHPQYGLPSPAPAELRAGPGPRGG